MKGNLIDVGTIDETRLTWDLRKKLDGINQFITTITETNATNNEDKIVSYDLTADLTLENTSKQYLFINPNGANRNVFLPSGTTGLIFFIRNTGDVDSLYYLEINNYLTNKKETIKPQTTKAYIYFGEWKPLNDRFIDFGLTGNLGEQSNSSYSNKAPFVTPQSIRSIAIGTDSYIDSDYSVGFSTSKLFENSQFAEGSKETILNRYGEIGRNISDSNQQHYNARLSWATVTETSYGTYEMFLHESQNKRLTLNDNSILTGYFVLNGIATNGAGEHYVIHRLLTLKRLGGANTVTIPNNTILFTQTPDPSIQSSIVANIATGDFEVFVTNGGVSYNRDMVWSATFYYTETRI